MENPGTSVHQKPLLDRRTTASQDPTRTQEGMPDGVVQASSAQDSSKTECGSEAGDSGEEGSALQQSYAALSRKEQLVIPANMHSSYLSRRRDLVVFIAGACEGLGLGRHCIHQAICYMDQVCLRANVAPRYLTDFAAACVLISSKMQDRLDDDPPLISHILQYDAEGTGTLDNVRSCELAILSYLDWNVMVATAHEFAQAMIESGSLSEGVAGMGTQEEEDAVNTKLREFVLYLADISIREFDFLEYKPSLVAAASVAAARVQLQVTPTWPASLQSLTGYRPEAVAGCSWLMCNIFDIERCSANNYQAPPGLGEGTSTSTVEVNLSPTNVELESYFN